MPSELESTLGVGGGLSGRGDAVRNRDAFDLGHLVTRQEYRSPGRRDVDHAFKKLAPNKRIETRCRLIENQQVRFVGHRQGQRNFPLHPFRQDFDGLIGRQFKPLSQVLISLLKPQWIKPGGKPADFRNGHPFVQGRAVRHVTDATTNLGPLKGAVESHHAGRP